MSIRFFQDPLIRVKWILLLYITECLFWFYVMLLYCADSSKVGRVVDVCALTKL